MSSVLTFGIAVHDLVFQVDEMPHAPVKHRAIGFAAVGGGTGANAAVTVARLGGRSLLASAIGDDGIGDTILAELEADGVDCRLVHRAPGMVSPVSAVFVDTAGERLVMNYKDPGLPNGMDFVPEDLSGIDAVMADVRWEDGSTALFERAKAHGIPRLLDADRAPVAEATMRHASHVALSAPALRHMSGETDLPVGLRRLAKDCAAELSVTDGAEGVFWLDGDIVRHLPAFAIEAVDTLGAGDVFHGALALALAEGKSGADAYRFASAAAAIKCTHFGGRAGIPNRAAVEALITETAG